MRVCRKDWQPINPLNGCVVLRVVLFHAVGNYSKQVLQRLKIWYREVLLIANFGYIT